MIKVTVGEQKTQSNLLPKLMIREDQKLIIAFTAHGKGIVLNGGTSPYSQFESVSNLSMDFFQDFTSSITLQNA